MKIAERIVMVVLALALIGGGAWFYFAIKYEQQEMREAVARGEYEIAIDTESDSVTATSSDATQSEWRQYYPVLVPVTVGSTSVMASVADSLPERIKGLSDTPYLPDGIVKLFAFGVAGEHSIWMKDMNYSIDIIWIAQDGSIVHIEENVSPDTFPESFASPRPAFYVIETNAGFVSENGIKIGDEVVIPVPET